MTTTQPVARMPTAARPLAPPASRSNAEYGLTAASGLGHYVEAVAEALELGPGGALWETAEHATAYLALDARSPAHPGRDVMLNWDENVGWLAATEPVEPAEQAIVLARLHGELLPAPTVVADFARRAAAGEYHDPTRPYVVTVSPGSSADTAERLAAWHHLLSATARHGLEVRS
ncbi:MAG: DUF6292 family protein [Nocardioidaceae bacterium]